MSTDIRRLVFGAIEGLAFHHGTRFRVYPADIACCRKAGVTGVAAQNLHVLPVPAKKTSGVAS